MRCADCKIWKTGEITKYADGSEIVNWQAPDGKGRCSVINIQTGAEFGCTSFVEELSGRVINPHVIRNWKNGAPWALPLSPLTVVQVIVSALPNTTPATSTTEPETTAWPRPLGPTMRMLSSWAW